MSFETNHIKQSRNKVNPIQVELDKTTKAKEEESENSEKGPEKKRREVALQTHYHNLC